MLAVPCTKYPRWWFDFARELTRFGARVCAYLVLLTDHVSLRPTDEQSVHLEIDYPDAERDLNRWLPLVKWLLAIPHYVVLVVPLDRRRLRGRSSPGSPSSSPGAIRAALFDYVVGVGSWSTPRRAPTPSCSSPTSYPPFSLS